MAEKTRAAAAFLHRAWRDAALVEALPPDLRPDGIDAGYAVQDALVEMLGGDVLGYKIAATSAAGQAHIAVDGPISGQLPATRVLAPGARAPMRGNHMRVAEAEFVFTFARDLPGGDDPLETRAVMDYVATLHLGIEIPNARYRDFATAGAPQLIADNACAHAFVLGPALDADFRALDLAGHEVTLEVDGTLACRGRGGDALGDPRRALTWFVNHYRARRRALPGGRFVTTGVCGKPAPVVPGQHVRADFGALGSLDVTLADAA